MPGVLWVLLGGALGVVVFLAILAATEVEQVDR